MTSRFEATRSIAEESFAIRSLSTAFSRARSCGFGRHTLAELVDALGKARRADKLRFYTRTALLIVDALGYVSIDPTAPTCSSSSSTPATRRAP